MSISEIINSSVSYGFSLALYPLAAYGAYKIIDDDRLGVNQLIRKIRDRVCEIYDICIGGGRKFEITDESIAAASASLAFRKDATLAEGKAKNFAEQAKVLREQEKKYEKAAFNPKENPEVIQRVLQQNSTNAIVSRSSSPKQKIDLDDLADQIQEQIAKKRSQALIRSCFSVQNHVNTCVEDLVQTKQITESDKTRVLKILKNRGFI